MSNLYRNKKTLSYLKKEKVSNETYFLSIHLNTPWGIPAKRYIFFVSQNAINSEILYKLKTVMYILHRLY